jgi:23S rRNA pseudouridine2604 synthase
VEKSNENSININKYISSTGICSRREAEKFIVEGKVTINGKVTQLGNRVFEGDIVKVNGTLLQAKPKTLYIAYHKPVGIVCTTDSKERYNIVKAIGHEERLFPIGRLDKPSEGLIFLTNDGDIVNKILRAGNNHEKEYIVTVNQPITAEFIQKMRSGIPILGTVTKKCLVEQLNKNSFKIILTQGLNRQIRRMCEYLAYDVTKLKRTRIMNVDLGNLEEGNWRELTNDEMNQINEMVSKSSKTEEASTDKQKKKVNTQSKRKFTPKNNNRFQPKNNKNSPQKRKRRG